MAAILAAALFDRLRADTQEHGLKHQPQEREEVLARVRAGCREDGEGALLMTYSAATPTWVTLLLAGFYVGAAGPRGRWG